ncbi:hypothetical protein AAFF_G00277620 [Aldrovandia affinis]|uniref:SH3 domain-containing protein n=1 Tax=Aldrovandia affinis TaxID=143900 RepID=A0AAD7W2F8_9TELE|nr:hypothetical protein AAFF_G00277620 [Aldrovandia affinis]
MSLSTVLAKALFDNVAESPEELGFRKGDILMVLEQEGGGPGWWVCSLHGRQGIAPANRLRLLNTASADSAPSLYLCPSSSPAPRPAPSADPAPRARSSSASRPRPDWDVGVTGRARSPSLRGRGSRGPRPPDAVYLAPSALPRAPPSEGGYLVPRVPAMPSEEVGVTKKDTPTCTPAGPREGGATCKEAGLTDGLIEEDKKKNMKKKEEGEYEEPDDENINNQVYDTPPTSRWLHTVAPAVCVDESIYNTPRALPTNADQGSEVYDVPTLPLAVTSDLQQQTYNVPACLAVGEVGEEDVYSVPSLPGDVCDGPGFEVEPRELYSVPGPRAPPGDAPAEGAGPDCGIYDMPALTADPPCARRSSVSSTSSGDIQWRGSLSALLQSALGSASLVPPPPARELAASLAEVLSGLLSLVRRALEDSAALLQSSAPPGRPRLPSQDSLSRRPLPALPVAEVKPLGGMGARKGSWIQERPLPPPPPPTFPLPPAPPILIPTNGQGEEEELGNEYAGIGLTAAPPPFNGGESGGYVKLQDSELLSFYSSQSLAHLSCLADSIDALFTSVQGNQPPRVFVSRGKSLIVTAHKLVFIGDTLSRLLTSPDLRAKVTTSGGRLCQALKVVVVATKGQPRITHQSPPHRKWWTAWRSCPSMLRASRGCCRGWLTYAEASSFHKLSALKGLLHECIVHY